MRICHAFVIHKGRMLLILRDNRPDIPNPNTWELPSGRIEDGEEPDAAIRRICDEQIGIVPTAIQLLGVHEHTYGYVAVLADDEAAKVKLGSEGQKLEFARLSEATQLILSPRLNHMIRSYGSAIQKMLDGEPIEPEDIGLQPV